MAYANIDDMTRRIAGDLYHRFAPVLETMYTAVAMRADAYLAEQIPVDTGYLRFSRVLGLNGDVPEVPEKRPKAKAGEYAGEAAQRLDQNALALRAFKLGDIVGIYLTANYAVFVEDKVHMVENTRAALPSIVRGAVSEVARGIPNG